jgi:hypothetical protein
MASEISALLERRVTFGQGLKALEAAAHATSDPTPILDLLPRLVVLLKTRHSNPAKQVP